MSSNSGGDRKKKQHHGGGGDKNKKKHPPQGFLVKTKQERDLIDTIVSISNRCRFCTIGHAEAARGFTTPNSQIIDTGKIPDDGETKN